jgi:hypothetical protein
MLDDVLAAFIENFAPGFLRLGDRRPRSNTILEMSARDDFGLFVVASPAR